jgi:BolA protein
MTEEEIIDRVKGLYPDALIDVSGADCSFEMYIISDAMQGMGLLQRQQSILGLFKDELATGKLHALSVKAKTQQEQAGGNSLLQIQS